MGNIHMKFGQVVQEELSFKEKVYTQGIMHDGQRPIKIAHLEPLAQVS